MLSLYEPVGVIVFLGILLMLGLFVLVWVPRLALRVVAWIGHKIDKWLERKKGKGFEGERH